MKFIKLTVNKERDEHVHINPAHIISIEDYDRYTYVVTSASSKGTYTVYETAQEIMMMIGGSGTQPHNIKTNVASTAGTNGTNGSHSSKAPGKQVIKKAAAKTGE